MSKKISTPSSRPTSTMTATSKRSKLEMEMDQDIASYWHKLDNSTATRISELQKKLKSLQYRKTKVPKISNDAFPQLRELGLILPSLSIHLSKKEHKDSESVNIKQKQAFEAAITARRARKQLKLLNMQKKTLANIAKWKAHARLHCKDHIQTIQLQRKIQSVDFEVKDEEESIGTLSQS